MHTKQGLGSWHYQLAAKFGTRTAADKLHAMPCFFVAFIFKAIKVKVVSLKFGAILRIPRKREASDLRAFAIPPFQYEAGFLRHGNRAKIKLDLAGAINASKENYRHGVTALLKIANK
jgi:hypothetical protein